MLCCIAMISSWKTRFLLGAGFRWSLDRQPGILSRHLTIGWRCKRQGGRHPGDRPIWRSADERVENDLPDGFNRTFICVSCGPETILCALWLKDFYGNLSQMS
jgi:hypothetical protein